MKADPRQAKAAELSALFANAGWTPSEENFKPRPFVKWHGEFFSAAGFPPGQPCRSRCRKTAEGIIEFLNEASAPPAPEVPPAPIEPPTSGLEEELSRLRAENKQLKAREPEVRYVEKIVHVPADSPGPPPIRAAEEGTEEPIPSALDNILKDIVDHKQVQDQLLARLVQPDPDEEAKKAALMQRLIDLQGLERLGAMSKADWEQFNQLTEYARWFK